MLSEGSDVDMFAYRIREALYIASLYPSIYPELSDAYKRFRVEIVDNRSVQAIPKPEATEVVGRGLPVVVTHGLVHGEKAPPDLMGPQTAASVIQAWHNTQPSNTPMHFPQANMTEEELTRLYQWGMERTPHWLIFYGINGQLTIRMREGKEDGLYWEPGDGV